MTSRIIDQDKQENAQTMVMNTAQFVGWIGNIRYYILDGNLWSWPFGGKIAVCEDKELSAKMANNVLALNK